MRQVVHGLQLPANLRRRRHRNIENTLDPRPERRVGMTIHLQGHCNWLVSEISCAMLDTIRGIRMLSWMLLVDGLSKMW